MMPEVALLAKRGWLPLIMRLVVGQYLYLGTIGIVQSHGSTDGNTHRLVQCFYFFWYCIPYNVPLLFPASDQCEDVLIDLAVTNRAENYKLCAYREGHVEGVERISFPLLTPGRYVKITTSTAATGLVMNEIEVIGSLSCRGPSRILLNHLARLALKTGQKT